MRRGRKSLSQTPAPLKERIKGSKKNPKGSASSKSSAIGIKLSDSIINTLENKRDEYNKEHPNKKVSLATLKAVMRRGMGAYSVSHRPTISGGAPNTRQAWGFARVNKFLKKKEGQKVKAAYVQDDDLMEKGGISNMEITCHNCGWHWNTDDSDESDKYVCHNCGYDNKSYYMKLGGKLKTPPSILQIAKKHKMKVTSLMKPLKEGIKVEMEHTNNSKVAKTIALHHLYESPKYYEKLEKMEKSFKDGGEVVAHASGKVGGVLVGRRHSEGGIKAINKSNNQPIEMEGGEVVITRNAVSDSQKREFEGEMLTNKEILSRINQSGGGVAFADGGKVNDCGCSGKKYKYGGKMMTDFDIVKSIRGASKAPMEFNRRALDMSGVKYANLKPSEAVEKLFGKIKFEGGGVLDSVGDTIQLINKRLPSLKGFLKLTRWVESPFEDDLSRYVPIKQFKSVVYAKGGDIDMGTITNAQAYKTYLFDNFGIKFRDLPAKIQNALLMGEQRLIDNYING